MAEGRGVEGLLVLEVRREVDAVVLTDVMDSLRRELLGSGRDAHSIENMTTGREIAAESTGTDISQTCELALADKTVLIVKVDHKLLGNEFE